MATRAVHPRFRPRVECLEERSLPTATATVLIASLNPAQTGQSVTFTATITGGDFAAGGDSFVFDSVTFLDGMTTLGTASPKPTGGPNHESRAQFTTSALTPGSHAITAKYSGGFDVINLLNNGGSTSNAVAEVVPPAVAADVSALVSAVRVPVPGQRGGTFQVITLHNNSGGTVAGPLYVVLDGLPARVRLKNASGGAQKHGKPGDPFLVDDVTLNPGGALTFVLLFSNPRHKKVHFTTEVLAGPGTV
jgi:hypothetical protein